MVYTAKGTEIPMMKKLISCILVLLMLLVPVTSLASETEAPAQAEAPKSTTFVVLQTADINGKETYDGKAIGFGRLATLVKMTAEENATLLLDSGNALAGDGGKTIKAMELAQYTAAGIGTKDASLGIERLQELAGRANFPLLCANWLRVDGELFFDPYTVVEVDGTRIGIIGLISPEIKEIYPDITEGCNVYDPAPIANIYYDQMKEAGCTYFIALTSLGYEGDYTPRKLATEAPWLNLILDSNTTEETVLDVGELVEKTNVVVFNVIPGFQEIAELTVVTAGESGMGATYPAIYNAESMSVVPDDEIVAAYLKEDYYEPGEEPAGDASNEPTIVKTNGKLTIALYALALIAVVVVTGGLIYCTVKGVAVKDLFKKKKK